MGPVFGRPDTPRHTPRSTPKTTPRGSGGGRGRSQSQRRGKSNQLCHFFPKGTCKNGSSCLFRHQSGSSRSSRSSSRGSNRSSGSKGSKGSGSRRVRGAAAGRKTPMAPEKKAKQPCRLFAQSGECQWGDNCKFLHVAGRSASAQSSSGSSKGSGGSKGRKKGRKRKTRSV